MVTRLDLDGTYSPMGLVTKILEAEPNLKIPVPIEDLARDLDIAEIETVVTNSFEGGLITNKARTTGGILIRQGVTPQRRRFTIGHELCHFLIPYHTPAEDGHFRCDRQAMQAWDLKTQKAANKMEAQANLFSALLLMPPPHLRALIKSKKYTSLSTVLEIAEHFDVSKEAAARCFVDYCNDDIAIIVARNGNYIRSYRGKKFPWIDLMQGKPIPEASLVHTYPSNNTIPSDSEPTGSEFWIATDYGKRIPKMYEQVLPQANGFAMILLKVLLPDEDDYDPEDNMTSKERFQRQQNRWNNY